MRYLAAALTLALHVTPAAADGLNKSEQAFVANAVMGLMAASSCDAKLVSGGLATYGDTIGVDTEKFNAAIQASLAVQLHRDYDRSDLIPAVTMLMNNAIDTFSNELKTRKAKTCGDITKILRTNGIIE